MISRRDALKQFATGSALGFTGAVIVATTSCAPTEAPAAIRDPLFEAITAYETARERGNSMPFETDEQTAACEAYFDEVCDPLFWKIKGLAPTTMAGAALAIRFLRDESQGGTSALEDSLFDGLIGFLEGRVA